MNQTCHSATTKMVPGTILCTRQDGFGEITVAEDGFTRSLYFGSVLQSTIRTDQPDLLLEDYNEALMCGLLFNAAPSSVLLIGLGGCSLIHFLLKANPGCTVDAVEIRQQVIDLSQEFFFLPRDNERLRVFRTSGQDFISSCVPGSSTYDLIIVDAFDESGPAVSLLQQGFLSDCRSRMSEKGVFVLNAWNSPAHDFPGLYETIQETFGSRTLKFLLSESYRNAVIFGFTEASTCRDLLERRTLAARLQHELGINFPRYLRLLYWQNFDDREQ